MTSWLSQLRRLKSSEQRSGSVFEDRDSDSQVRGTETGWEQASERACHDSEEQAQMDALRWRAHRDAVQAKKTWDVGSLQITHRK